MILCWFCNELMWICNDWVMILWFRKWASRLGESTVFANKGGLKKDSFLYNFCPFQGAFLDAFWEPLGAKCAFRPGRRTFSRNMCLAWARSTVWSSGVVVVPWGARLDASGVSYWCSEVCVDVFLRMSVSCRRDAHLGASRSPWSPIGSLEPDKNPKTNKLRNNSKLFFQYFWNQVEYLGTHSGKAASKRMVLNQGLLQNGRFWNQGFSERMVLNKGLLQNGWFWTPALQNGWFWSHGFFRTDGSEQGLSRTDGSDATAAPERLVLNQGLLQNGWFWSQGFSERMVLNRGLLQNGWFWTNGSFRTNCSEANAIQNEWFWTEGSFRTGGTES